MTPWTDSARRCFSEYTERARQSLGSDRVDVNEVLEDLERHINEEVRVAGLTVLTEEQLRHILAKLGDPALLAETQTIPATARLTEHQQIPNRKKPGILLLLLGIVLPAITILFELLTGISAGVLFDPLPSWAHVVIVALVPISNLWMWMAGRSGEAGRAVLLGWLNGAAIGVSLLYALLLVPFTPFACVAVIYFGLGLIPLAPLGATIATPLLRAAYCRSVGQKQLPGLWPGMSLAVGVLIALQVPSLVTYHGLAKAVSDDPETSRRGVRLLRRMGDEEMLLRACYGQFTRSAQMDVAKFIASGDSSVNADQARTIYYRVTGRPFNSVPPPSLYTRAGRWDAFDQDFTWDDALGGDAVAGRVKGLSLASSRLDAVAEPVSALVYCEWTLEFKNVSSQQREARAQIALPPGGVVSRLTLWVDGEEREAAFAGRSAVKQAYRQVAVVQRRDPVLLTTCGPDRVLMQCFPIPANGGSMKIRVGITAPLMLEGLDRGRFLWPSFLERNFTVAAQFQHSLWLESPDVIENGNPAGGPTAGGKFNWRSTVTERDLEEAATSVLLRRSGEVKETWFPGLVTGDFIRQTIQASVGNPFNRIVFVVDGSAGMERFIPEIAEALSVSNGTFEMTALFAGDEPEFLLEKPQKASLAVFAQLRQQLNRKRCEGGQDNLPALEKAWDIAAEGEHGIVLWLHGPQPALLGSTDGLRQRLERAGSKVELYEMQVRAGPDRIVEKLDGLASVHHVPRIGALRADLTALYTRIFSQNEIYITVRELVHTQPASARKATSRHIERLWAREEIARQMAVRDFGAAVEIAGRQQIVTPCSGAVVLETKQQFQQNNLTPADPQTVPAIPEPETWMLLASGLAVLFLIRRRRQRVRA